MRNITKMGRPPKDPSEKLSKTVTVRMTDEEYNKLRDDLGDSPISVALRQLIFDVLSNKES